MTQFNDANLSVKQTLILTSIFALLYALLLWATLNILSSVELIEMTPQGIWFYFMLYALGFVFAYMSIYKHLNKVSRLEIHTDHLAFITPQTTVTIKKGEIKSVSFRVSIFSMFNLTRVQLVLQKGKTKHPLNLIIKNAEKEALSKSLNPYLNLTP